MWAVTEWGLCASIQTAGSTAVLVQVSAKHLSCNARRACLYSKEKCDCSTSRHNHDSCNLASKTNKTSENMAAYINCRKTHPGPQWTCAVHAEVYVHLRYKLLPGFVLLKLVWVYLPVRFCYHLYRHISEKPLH